MNKLLYRWGFAACLVTGLSGCLATPKDEDAAMAFYQKVSKSTSANGAKTGLEAFTNTYYPFARANCMSCHGSAQAPLFAVSGVVAAYDVAKTAAYVNFNSPASSKLATKSGDGHCGLPGCSGNSGTAASLISEWAKVELAVAANPSPTPGSTGMPGGPGGNTNGAPAGSTVTTAVAVPANIPTSTAYVPMRWPLNSVSPANAMLAGAIFEIEAQKLNASTYRVRNPRILGLSAAVRITGIHIYVKSAADGGIGVEDLGSGSVWSNIVVTAPASTITNQPANAPATSNPAVPALDSFANLMGVRSNSDVFTISFNSVATAVPLTNTFASINANILAPKCVGCHNNATPNAGKNYATYQTTINSGNASTLASVQGGANASMPPGSLKLSAAEVTALQNWINAGAPNN